MTGIDTPQASPAIVIRRVPVEAVRPLRHLVLRPGWPEEAVHADRDDDSETVHLAAFAGEDIVGVVTMFPEQYPDDERGAERFRWMAVDETRQGSGIGHALLREAALLARDGGFEVMWAKGRETALGFYERLGFRFVGDAYTDAPTQIRHRYVIIETATLIGG